MRRTVPLGLLLLALSGVASCGGAGPTPDSIRGLVVDEHGPLRGATVRVQTTECATVTDAFGRFTLPVAGLPPGPHRLTAWAPGYFCAGPVEGAAGQRDVRIQLEEHATADNPDYAWLPSVPHPELGGDPGCSECHASPAGEPAGSLPVDEWLLDAHAGSARNPRFLTLYLGTDVWGNESPLTRHFHHPDYGLVPLPPDPSLPYYGPGYKLDFPDTTGSCAACHTPAAAIEAPYGVDPTAVDGIAQEGMPCDFCHKIWDVVLDPLTGLPYEDRPGVVSMTFRRPPDGSQLFAGPYDDVAPGEDTRLPLQTESRFCAPCHFGVFWGVQIYDSFGEWLRSPYSDPLTGRTCQDCHMPQGEATHFVRPDKGGLERDPATIFSHRMPGAADEALLQSALTLRTSARAEGGQVVVDVEVTNDRTGHKVPTDSPLRHVILLVRAYDAGGAPLAQTVGPTLPAWCGLGDPDGGNYADLAGKAFALVLEELWTEIAPTGAYWNPTRVVSDTRLAPYAGDADVYAFADAAGLVTVEVQLIFRRAFIDLARQKGWDVPDIVMAEQTLQVE